MVPTQRTELAQAKFLCGKQTFRIVDGDALEIRYDRFTLLTNFKFRCGRYFLIPSA